MYATNLPVCAFQCDIMTNLKLVVTTYHVHQIQCDQMFESFPFKFSNSWNCLVFTGWVDVGVVSIQVVIFNKLWQSWCSRILKLGIFSRWGWFSLGFGGWEIFVFRGWGGFDRNFEGFFSGGEVLIGILRVFQGWGWF